MLPFDATVLGEIRVNINCFGHRCHLEPYTHQPWAFNAPSSRSAISITGLLKARWAHSLSHMGFRSAWLCLTQRRGIMVSSLYGCWIHTCLVSTPGEMKIICSSFSTLAFNLLYIWFWNCSGKALQIHNCYSLCTQLWLLYTTDSIWAL